MHIEFLIEELSAETALGNLLPKILGNDISFEIHTFQCKSDLLNNLPQRMKGYARWIPEDYRIVVLLDEDRSDCIALKESLEKAAIDAGLATKTSSSTSGISKYQVMNRIAVEELEAWFFGDPSAIHSAYPRIPATIGTKSMYRDPDAIRGGTWEALERVLKRAGYFQSGLRKIEASKAISSYMDPGKNTSKSFQIFRNGLQEMVRWGV
jgi:hypothetical protein